MERVVVVVVVVVVWCYAEISGVFITTFQKD
jgi:hypothetical protein